MTARLWSNFRQGNRSEDLARYILSGLGLAAKIQREEDIGVDFNCLLAKSNGSLVTFHSPFLLQIKSISQKKEIVYGGIDRNEKWKKDEINWLFSQELPFLIGLVDKEKLSLSLYTTSNMWAVWYQTRNIAQIQLCPDTTNGISKEIPSPTFNHNTEKIDEWKSKNIGDGMKWIVPLGPALVSLSASDSNNEEKLEVRRQILSSALKMEQENITYRRLNVHVSYWPLVIKTNAGFSSIGAFASANPVPGANIEEQLQALYPILYILGYNYKTQNNNSEFEKIKEICAMLPDPKRPEILGLMRSLKLKKSP